MIRLLTSFLTGATALILAGCGGGHEAEVRYKVTVEVSHQGESYSGSSVWSRKLSEPTLALATPYSGEFKGEAVRISLRDGGALFAILRGADGNQGAAQMLPERLFGDIARDARGEATRFGGDRIADLRTIASNVGLRGEMDCHRHPDWCPMLVTFDDPNDPVTVRKVEPFADPAFRLQRLVVEITTEPVTTGIEAALPWLSVHPEPRLDPHYRGSTNPSLAQRLWHGDFRRGTTISPPPRPTF